MDLFAIKNNWEQKGLKYKNICKYGLMTHKDVFTWLHTMKVSLIKCNISLLKVMVLVFLLHCGSHWQ